MKATYLLVIAALGFSTISFGQEDRQEDTREDLKFGLRAGANLSNVWDENSNDFEANSKLGFAGGAFMSVPLGKYLGIQPAMIFSQKGFEENGRVLGSDYTFTRTTNYLDIPILLELKPKQFLTIVAGPQYSFLMSKTDQFSSGTISVSDVDQYQNENIRKNTLGAVVGLDFHSNRWVVSPRAGWDLLSNNGDGSSSSLRYKNQWVQLTIGYEFQQYSIGREGGAMVPPFLIIIGSTALSKMLSLRLNRGQSKIDMAGKDKLRRFAAVKEFDNFYEPVINQPFDLKGNWRSKHFKNDNPIVLELGCGKGEYSVGLGNHFPDKNFIGVDIKGARMFIGAEQALNDKMENVAFLRTRIDFITDYFEEGEVDEIWLTFSDPQRKKPNKRLSSPVFIERYRKILKPGGIVHMKTDSDLLFEYTEDQIKTNNYELLELTWDLYGELPEKIDPLTREIFHIKTHYEKLFTARGSVIKYAKFKIH